MSKQNKYINKYNLCTVSALRLLYFNSVTVMSIVKRFSPGAHWLILCGDKQKRQCEPLNHVYFLGFRCPTQPPQSSFLCSVPS